MKATESIHPVTLQFLDREVEEDYQRKLRPRVRRQFRVSVGSSLFLWPLAAIIAYPLLESGWSILIAAPAMCLILLLLLVAERMTESLQTIHLLGAISNTSAGLALLAILWLEDIFTVLGPLAVLQVAVFSFALLNLPFLLSLLAVTPYIVACVVLMVISPSMPYAPIRILVLLVVTGVLAVTSYLREGAARRDFYLTRVIADQERELEEEKAQKLGPYTLESKLGQGGMGVVYRASHALLRRPTAVKVLSTKDASPEVLACFEREVQLTSELSHPNIIAIYDYGRSFEGEFYYAMEYLPGIDLESLVAGWGQLPPERVVPILLQICDGLAEAHHRGLVHRDIKPANIILSRLGTRVDVVKILDFGLVKEIESPSDLGSNHHFAGTPAYMSPEAVSTPGQIGPASDLYALGAIGFYLLAGDVLFTGSTLQEIFDHHLKTPPRSPSSESKYSVPHALDEIILRCLAKNPQDRFPSAASIREALAAVDVGVYTGGERWWEKFEGSRVRVEEPISSDLTLKVHWQGR